MTCMPTTLYPLQTSDAERIGVDQVAKILPSGKASGSEQCKTHSLMQALPTLRVIDWQHSLKVPLVDVLKLKC